MSNILVKVSGTVDVSEETLTEALGRPDDGSQEWHEQAALKAEELCEDNDFLVSHLSGDFELDAS